MLPIRVRFLFLYLVLSLSFATEAARSEGVLLLESSPLTNLAAVVINASDVFSVREAGRDWLNLRETPDPYLQTAWQVRFTEFTLVPGEKLVLEVTYYDKGPGVIQPFLLADDSFHGRWIPPARKVSFTRLNTLAERRALFEFDVPSIDWSNSTHPHLKIVGLQYLGALRAYSHKEEGEWEELAASVPTQVEPLVKLERSMEITCTVGIEDVGNPPSLENSLANIREYGPLAKLLGFTSIECFVRWDMVEPEKGRFDFSHYDAIAEAIEKCGMKWFPNLVITSAFALPKWYFESSENIGMVCLEHGGLNQVPSIWNEANKGHVTRVLSAFGRHYEPMGILEAVRLGPSGNFGEAQYPAGAGSALGYGGKPMHAHIGWWCGDPLAVVDFRRFLESRYSSIDSLNQAWKESFADFSDIRPQLPETYHNHRGRIDMTDWCTASMTDWCGFWAQEARKAMPSTKIYQSSGGWGFREAGTDFSAQTRSMKSIGNSGIRLTNETDSFEQNFYATRLAATAARHYGIALGYEPAGYHSARGVVGRFFSTAATNGSNLYTRHSVLFTDPYSVDNWLRDYHLLDKRADPIVDVAVYYPETMNQIDDGAFRHLYAWGFNPRAAEIRRRVEVDFLDDLLIREGFLERYKVLVFCWGNILPEDVLKHIDRWIRSGGTAIFPTFPRGDYQTIEGAPALFQAWEQGDVGKGRFFRFKSDMEPISLYGDFVESILETTPDLHPGVARLLRIDHPPQVFSSLLETGDLLLLNYSNRSVGLNLEEEGIKLEPYSIFLRPGFIRP